MHLLVTGGAGFIGANMVELALAQGCSVSVIDDLSTGYEANLDGLEASFVRGSILDPGALDDAMQGVDSVIHLAALGSVPRSVKDPVASHHANATGTLNVLEAVRRHGIGHVVVASSSSVYGLNTALPKRERDWVRPMSPYAVTKLAGEQYALAYQQSYGLDTLAFRFFNVYGPRQRAGHVYAAVIPIFIEALLAGRPLPIQGDGEQSRDFTFVETVCRILFDAAQRRVTHPEPVNLAFGTNTTINQLAVMLGEALDCTPAIEYLPPRAGDVRASLADNATLRSLFPDLQPVALEDGISRTIQWFKEEM